MPIAGIVAEYNPFHTGHGHQIARTRAALGQETGVVAVMSGNWVQQADCAIADKWTRARLALMGGADLVLELPTVWAMSSAESFARGAVEILAASGVVTHLSFGSECGDEDKLRQVAAALDSPEYSAILARGLEQGLPFAVCRQRAAEELLGPELGSLLATPNNNLGVEYIRALNGLGSNICPMTVLREGAAHNSISDDRPRFVSATQVRVGLMCGEWETVRPYLVPGSWELLREDPAGLPRSERVERAVLARVRTMTAEEWARLPDSGAAEGLPQRLEKTGRQCTSMEEFFSLAKTRRYTHARLRRLVLWAWLGLTAGDVPEAPPYLRVLGMNGRGRALLREMKEKALLPVLTKPAHARELGEEGLRLFELEARCTDLYDLCFEPLRPAGREWTAGPVVLD